MTAALLLLLPPRQRWPHRHHLRRATLQHSAQRLSGRREEVSATVRYSFLLSERELATEENNWTPKCTKQARFSTARHLRKKAKKLAQSCFPLPFFLSFVVFPLAAFRTCFVAPVFQAMLWEV